MLLISFWTGIAKHEHHITKRWRMSISCKKNCDQIIFLMNKMCLFKINIGKYMKVRMNIFFFP